MRLRCHADSKREMMEISRDIASLMADGEIFDKNSQKLKELFERYTEKIQSSHRLNLGDTDYERGGCEINRNWISKITK